jgi:hypothetical protein
MANRLPTARPDVLQISGLLAGDVKVATHPLGFPDVGVELSSGPNRRKEYGNHRPIDRTSILAGRLDGAASSGEFGLKLFPPEVELIDSFLRHVSFGLGGDQSFRVAGDGGICVGGERGLKLLFGFCDALFERCVLAGFQVREFFFRYASCSW